MTEKYKIETLCLRRDDGKLVLVSDENIKQYTEEIKKAINEKIKSVENKK